MESIKNIFKIGYGPSSSHTMGPAKVALYFKDKYPNMKYKVVLYGSLALTGRGHLTDQILKQILGEDVVIEFNIDEIYVYHSNAMRFIGYADDKEIANELWFSVGGGDVKQNNQNDKIINIYKECNLEEIIEYCENNQIDFVQYVEKYEENIKVYLLEVLKTMKQEVEDGLSNDTVLPGRLKVNPKAKTYYNKFLENNDYSSLLFSYSLAAAEQNARAGVVVTAPTCGSCGVLPAVLLSYQKFYNNITDDKLINSLIVAGIIGNVVKKNGSLSGAEVGCQGEIGVACSMAAAALTYLKGGNLREIEYAAEISLEHHLGMTCDPVDGLVQIPCIERNALAASFAVEASKYSLLSSGKHLVKFDDVVKVMKATGLDLASKYKETSVGGLALKFKE